MSDAAVEIIVRGVVVLDGKLLVCHTKGASNTYLPGGHIDFGEGARAALEREISEEMGLSASVNAFLGACEHSFVQAGMPHHEINLVFAMDVEGLDATCQPESKEDYIEFFWHELDDLPNSELEPESLRHRIKEWIADSGRPERWAAASRPESR